MTYIDLGNDLPGIRGLVSYRPESGKSLYALARILLSGESSLTQAERELIAGYVSSLNGCMFCTQSHAAAARVVYRDESSIVDEVLKSGQSHQLSSKINALLEIAARVQKNGKLVTKELVAKAKLKGATDREVHDTVLIASVFCLFNRYVDGLGAYTPENLEEYKQMGERMITNQYQFPKK